MYKCSCVVCKKEFSYMGIHTHYERAHLGKVYFHGNHGKYKNPEHLEKINKTKQNNIELKYGKYKDFISRCEKCKKQITVREREKLFPEKSKYFCSRSCANSRVLSDKTKEKISESVKLQNLKNKVNKKCSLDDCFNLVKKHNSKFCSRKCFGKDKKTKYEKSRSEYLNYRISCQFDFSLNSYPDKFDFSLINENGWYSPSTSKNPNPEGISRDHMFSIMDGFKFKIDPSTIKHPANCQLMKQKNNSSKGSKSSITFDELIDRINKW